MSIKGLAFSLILLVILASVVASSCLCSISCPCGSNSDKIYTQCMNNSFNEKYTCERWANCLTCRTNTNHCITCPPGRTGPACEESNITCPPGRIGPTCTEFKVTCPPGRTGPTCAETLHPTASCPDPGSIQNGYRRLAEGQPSRLYPVYNNGQTFEYFCNEGYVLHGNSVITCLPSRKWSSNTPWCQRLPIDPKPYCPDPGHITYGSYRNSAGDSVTFQKYPVGESVIYYCQSGYELVGKEMITCTDHGTWPMKPLCRRTSTNSETLNRPDKTSICPDPGSIQNGYRRLLNGVTLKATEMYKIGQTFEYYCNAGYELRGQNVLTCSNSGSWTNNKPWCLKSPTGSSPSGATVVCPDPNVDPNGDMQEIFQVDPRPKGQGFEAGSQVSFTCKSGYEIRGATTITCLINGQWTSEPPTCTRISVEVTPPSMTPSVFVCPTPVVDPNGEMEEIFPIDPRLKRRRFEPGSQVSFTCKNDYELNGSETIICLVNGQWTSEPPTCIKISDDTTSQPSETTIVCPDPVVDPNGEMEEVYVIDARRANLGFEAGSQVRFTCRSGYEMVGINTVTCLRTGRWTSDPPICTRISEEMDCGRSILQGGKITHSRGVNEGEFPWMVLISTGDSKTFTGILLDNTTVLTSAHPLENERQYKLSFFKPNRTSTVDDRFVETRWSSEIIIHPEYDSKTLENDLAIVKFSPDVSYSVNVEPICAPTLQSSARNIVPGQIGYLVGWGFTSENQKEVNANLMVAPIPIRATQSCLRDIQRLNPLLKLTSGMFCAGVPNAQKRNDVCYEGIGGALVFYNPQIKRFNLEGIASHRPPGRCYDPGNNIILTKVSNYVEWIMQNLAN